MLQRTFQRIKAQMWTSWCCHFVEIHPIAAVMDVRILCHPISLIGLLAAPAAASVQPLKTPITSIWVDNSQSLLPRLLDFVSTLMTTRWRKTSHWRFMEFDWRSRQETSRRERSRERGRASHSCRDGGGWERYLHGSKGQERDFNSLPVSAAGMTKLLSLPSGIHVHPSLPLSFFPPLVLSSAFSHSAHSSPSHSDNFHLNTVFVGSWLIMSYFCFLKTQILEPDCVLSLH